MDAEIQSEKEAIRRALGGHDSLQLHDDDAPGPTLGESPDTQIVRVSDLGGPACDSPYAEFVVMEFLDGKHVPLTPTHGQAAHAYAVLVAAHFGGTVLTRRPRDLTASELRLPPGVVS